MHRCIQLCLVCCFWLLISLPGLGALVGWGTWDDATFHSIERRSRTEFPPLSTAYASVRQWTNSFTRWFDDRYAFRHELISGYGELHYVLFGRSGFPEKTVVGRNGFLFLGDEHMRTFSTHAGLPTWNKKDVFPALGNVKALHRWLQRRGIPLMVTVAPDKATIYGENLPAWVRTPNTNLPTVHLRSALPQEEPALVLYNPELLQEAKKTYGTDLYHPGDTHWTDLGAFIYYEYIMDQCRAVLGQSLHVLSRPSYRSQPNAAGTNVGDLMSLMRYAYPFNIPVVNAEQWPPAMAKVTFPETVNILLTEKDAQRRTLHNPQALNPQKVLLVGDSFSQALVEFMHRTFQSVLSYHIRSDNTVLQQAIALYKPDVVILEVVERDALVILNQVLNGTPRVSVEEVQRLRADSRMSTQERLPLASLRSQGGRMVMHGEEGVFTAINNDPQLIWDLPPTAGKNMLVELEMTAPGPTTVLLYYATTKEPHFSEARTVRVQTGAGRVKVPLYLEADAPLTTVRLDPGLLVGDYHLHSLDVDYVPWVKDAPAVDAALLRYYSTPGGVGSALGGTEVSAP